ncbi:MAG: lipopolysaccharide heptosyltransferase II [Acidobacteriota bacterium]|nr:lipopolysaccharide heptosyltransferase II [Acidobacteriota bacterium]
MAEPKPEKIERIVVRGTNWVGDAVMTVPALRELRRVFPKAHITLATRSWARGLFADANFLDDLQVHDGRGLLAVIGQVREWRKRGYDLAVLFPNSFEAALIASLARVPLRVGYATDNRRALLTHPLSLPEWRSSKHEVFYYLKIVAEIEWLINHQQSFLDTQPDGSLEVADTRKSSAIDFLCANGIRTIPGGPSLVALCPGSINSRAKRWPAERYAALADILVDRLGAEVLLIGSEDELEVSLEVVGQMHNKPVMLTGKTDLAELVAILSLVDLLVTNDTGAAHIASALGRPTLAIFGPTNPLTTRPFSPFGEIVRHPPECAPCMLRDCPIDHRCMTAITPDEIFERAAGMLSDKLQFVAFQRTPLSEAIDKLKFVGQVK